MPPMAMPNGKRITRAVTGEARHNANRETTANNTERNLRSASARRRS